MTVEDNQRLHLAYVGNQWAQDPDRNGDAAVRRYPHPKRDNLFYYYNSTTKKKSYKKADVLEPYLDAQVTVLRCHYCDAWGGLGRGAWLLLLHLLLLLELLQLLSLAGDGLKLP